ncbi:hypothetical protein MY149_02075 [Acinetobacter indicus]|nr:hypothetical protein [Acinetobacter indicus]
MSDWVGLFINYETVGKQLKPHKTEALNRRQSESETLSPHRAVIQINNTYLELIDRWNYQRGFITVLSLAFILILFGFVYIIVYFGFFNPFPNSGVGEMVLGEFFNCIFRDYFNVSPYAKT